MLGLQQDTEHHQLDTLPAGEFHSAVLFMEVPLAMGAASVIPEWQLAGLSAHLRGVEAQDSTAGVLEAEDFQEGGAVALDLTVGVLEAEASRKVEAGGFQEAVAGAEDEIQSPR